MQKCIICLLFGLLLNACGATSNLGTWKNPEVTGPAQKMLIIAVAEESFLRQQFENVMRNSLASHDVIGVPSYPLLPQKVTQADRERIEQLVAERDIDSVLVAVQVNKQEVRNDQTENVFYLPAAGYTGPDWYPYFFDALNYKRRYSVDIFTISTKLFDTSRQQLVWGNLAEVKIANSREKAINEFIPFLVDKLQGDGMIP